MKHEICWLAATAKQNGPQLSASHRTFAASA
jgi:hypothetical protein